MSPLILFHVEHVYYLPQFLPVAKELDRRGADCRFTAIDSDSRNELLQCIADREGINLEIVGNNAAAVDLYNTHRPNWIVFGNIFRERKHLAPLIKTAMLYHGIGIKDCYYDAGLQEMDVRFVEGRYREKELLRRFPDCNVVRSGFAKLDPLADLAHPVCTLNDLKLSPERKTLLYAPTFYPSSIEKMARTWPADFPEYNIIIKPHQFSVNLPEYRNQKKLLAQWGHFSNVYLAGENDFSIVPFMACADILISDASSVLFEFAALNKPVIWCDFIKLRWSYRGVLNFRYKKRMDGNILMKYKDIAAHVDRYSDLRTAVDQELKNPARYEKQRRQYSGEIVGDVSGKASVVISDYLLSC
ncbi:CDP-glycerol glycerophosphotransferase family protein [Thermodesulfobacteriota bacterium]